MNKISESRKKKIVAASWHPGGANAISPVIKRLINEDKIEVVTIGYQFSEEIFQSKDVNYRTITSCGLRDVSVDSMTQLLKLESPDLVLVGTSSQDENNKNVIEQTLALAARIMGIKSLAVLDFWANYSLRFSDIYTGEKFKFLPDKIAIMDQIAQQAMLNEGFDRKRLVITGNPHFDDLSDKSKNFTEDKRQTIREKIGLPIAPLILYAGNAFKKEKEVLGYWDLDIIDLINEVVQGLPIEQRKKVRVMVKLHPRVPNDDLTSIGQYITRNAKDVMKLIRNINTQELVLASELTLVSTSTVGIEAVYMKKPCISLQPGLKGEGLFLISKKGIIPVGYTSEDCKALLTKAILDSEYREIELLKRSSSFETDGKATERVTNLIYTMLEQ